MVTWLEVYRALTVNRSKTIYSYIWGISADSVTIHIVPHVNIWPLQSCCGYACFDMSTLHPVSYTSIYFLRSPSWDISMLGLFWIFAPYFIIDIVSLHGCGLLASTIRLKPSHIFAFLLKSRGAARRQRCPCGCVHRTADKDTMKRLGSLPMICPFFSGAVHI